MRTRSSALLVGGLLASALACSAQSERRADASPSITDARPPDPRPDEGLPIADARPLDARPDSGARAGADVTAVSVRGDAGAYTFSVTLSSPDTGCDRYANWWEVLDADGRLLYRRILGHSHVDEQPFTRSGGPVAADADSVLWIRGHMHPGGYGGVVMRGTPATGFSAAAQPDGWPDVSAAEPQPSGCAF